MSEFKNPIPADKIPLSPLESSNEQNISKLDDFSFQTGTTPGQSQTTLYSAILDLCKEKKMSYFKPAPYFDYLPAKMAEGKESYIYFSVKDPGTGKMRRIKHKINHIKSVRERRSAARQMIARINEQLSLGWNPLLEKIAPLASMRLNEAMDSFLRVKTKETEDNSMRSYRSYIKTLKTWLKENRYPEDMYVCAFSASVALDFMNDVEDDDRISPRTFNNYRAFYTLLWNWMKEKGYTSANPFVEIKKKPKRLTKKIRRSLTDSEIHRLVHFLSKENPNYLAACLLCYCCFLRPKEIAGLYCRDIDLEKQLVRVDEGIAKNDNSSYRTIPDVILPYLNRLNLSCPDWHVFSDAKTFAPGSKKMCSREIARYWNDVVRPGCGFSMDLQFYSLKDTGISNMAESGIPLTFVQQQADHSSLSVTEIYISHSRVKAQEEIKEVDILNQ